MLHEKIFPSFYLIEVEDAAVRALIDQQFSVQKVIIASNEFSDDIAATHAAKEAVKFFIKSSPIDTSSAVEDVKLNPEFYPTADKLDPALIEKNDELLAAEIEEKDVPAGRMLVPLTRNFDPAGDFVQARSVVTGSNFKITTRIATTPTIYLQSKVEEGNVLLDEPHRGTKKFWLQ